MIALIDCNNFFASCERLFRPDLRTRPVIVLSSNDGCVVARSQEAKELGVQMGVPYFQIRDIVAKSQIAVFSSNFALYSNLSQRILRHLRNFSPTIEVYSIDEAFVSLDNLPIKNYQEYGDKLRSLIMRDIGMPVSVGIAPNKTLAKIASDWAKKHQQTCLIDLKNDHKGYRLILEKTPIEDVWGIGCRLSLRFQAVSIKNAWQLASISEKWVKDRFNISVQNCQKELKGEICFEFEAERQLQKSLIVSRSFGHTVGEIHELETAVADFASSAAYKLRLHHQKAGVFGVFARFRDQDGSLKSNSRFAKLSRSSNDTSELVMTALSLLEKLYDKNVGYKKCGIFAYQLSQSAREQMMIFDTKDSLDKLSKRQNLMQAIDQINQRFGSGSLHIGTIDPSRTKWHVKSQRRSPLYVTDWNQLPKVYNLS